MRKSILFFSLLVPALFSACVKPLEEMPYNATVVVACDQPVMDWSHRITVSGRIVAVEGPEVTNRGFVYGPAPNPVVDWSNSRVIYSEGDSFEASFNRPAWEHCYVRAFAQTSNGITYSYSQHDVLSDVDFSHLSLDDFSSFDCSSEYYNLRNVRALLVTENITNESMGSVAVGTHNYFETDYYCDIIWMGGPSLSVGLNGNHISNVSWYGQEGLVQTVVVSNNNPDLQMRFTRTNIGLLIEFSDNVFISKVYPYNQNTAFCGILRYTHETL